MFARLILTLLATSPVAPAFAQAPDQLSRYTECMTLARRDPIRVMPAAEKWLAEGGGMGARHCIAVALLEGGKPGEAAGRFEAIARDMGQERPGLRAELWVQAGQAWTEAGQLEKAVAAQGIAIELKPGDPDLWIDRGLSHAALRAWPKAVADFDRALGLKPDTVEILVLRSAAWRNAGDTGKALADSERALLLAVDHSEALLEHGFALLARGDRQGASADFSRVLKLVPPGSDASRRAEAGLRGELPSAAAPVPGGKGAGKR